MTASVSPSILNCDFERLDKAVEIVNSSSAEYIHLDIMDGVFVPNISFGFPVAEAVARMSEKPLDVHLMTVNPENLIDRFAALGARLLTVHYEACPHLHRVLQQIHDAGMLAGVALNPHTPVSVLQDVLEDCDLVLVMSVNPGFGGQKFIRRTYSKVAEIKLMIIERGLKCLVQVDGGVTPDNARALHEAGVDVFVAGSAVFKADDPLAVIESLRVE